MIRGRGKRRSQRRLGAEYRDYSSEYQATAAALRLQALPPTSASHALRGNDTGRVSKLLAAGLVAALAWASYVVFTSASFYVSQVDVQGNSMVATQEIRAISEMEGMSIFWVDTDAVRSRIEALPGVKSARVQVSLPAEVTITVDERAPQLVWTTGDDTWWIDTEGVAIEPRGVLDGAITITDVDDVPLRAGEPVAPGVLGDIAALHNALPRLAKMLYSHDQGIGFSTAEGWPVYLGDGSDIEAKLTVLKALRRRLLEQGTTPQLIDLRFPQQPVYR